MAVRSAATPALVAAAGPASVAQAALAVYRPTASRARTGWSLARAVASLGVFRLLPGRIRPPAAVRRILAPHVPVRGTVAVSRANHPGRYGALLLTHEGGSSAYAKVALDDPGVETLEREDRAIVSLGGLDRTVAGSSRAGAGSRAPRAGVQ